jgi:hypothetical protein
LKEKRNIRVKGAFKKTSNSKKGSPPFPSSFNAPSLPAFNAAGLLSFDSFSFAN